MKHYHRCIAGYGFDLRIIIEEDVSDIERVILGKCRGDNEYYKCLVLNKTNMSAVLTEDMEYDEALECFNDTVEYFK